MWKNYTPNQSLVGEKIDKLTEYVNKLRTEFMYQMLEIHGVWPEPHQIDIILEPTDNENKFILKIKYNPDRVRTESYEETK